MTKNSITVLSFGGGQDSTALLHLYRKDPSFRERYIGKSDFLVVMSATGDEFPQTDEHVKNVAQMCHSEAIPFFHLTPDQGWHNEPCQDLMSWYKLTDSCGSKAYPKTCTDNFKLQPIYKFLEHWLARDWAPRHNESQVYAAYGRKKAFKVYAARHGKIRMMIGIAAGEERRAKMDPEAIAKWPKWKQVSIENVYPLIDLGLDRQGCQDLIRGYGEIVPFPSNCRRCPFLNDIELLFLKRHHPEELEEWIEVEAAKLRRDEVRDTPPEKRYGVFLKTYLPEKVKEVEDKHGHMTDAELFEYRNSHGHCVMSSY